VPASTTSLPELTVDQVQRILVKPLEAKSVFLASGPRIFDVTAAGPVRIPKLVGMTAPSWIGENTLIPEVEAETDEVVLLDGIKSLKSLTRFSNEMARSSVVALDAALQDRMVFDVASKLDAAFIAGTGDPVNGKRTTPLGIINYAGTQEMADVGTLSIDDLHDAVGMMLGANADPARARWLMTSRDFVALRKVKSGTGSNAYVLQPDPTLDTAYRLLGLPVTITNRIPADGGAGDNESSVVLADFSQIAVARDLAPSVKILDQTYADYDQQAIRVVAHYDAAPLNPEAVVVLRGVTV
jgi:HK97 family phage major capsid protein